MYASVNLMKFSTCNYFAHSVYDSATLDELFYGELAPGEGRGAVPGLLTQSFSQRKWNCARAAACRGVGMNEGFAVELGREA